MTEITENKATHRDHYAIDAVAFFAALVAAPLVTTACTFFLVIPVFSLIGLPFYLIFGAPALLWHLSRRPVRAGEIALLAFCVNLLALILCRVMASALPPYSDLETYAVLLGYGLIFAPLWGAVFAWLYSSFMNPLYRAPM